LHFVINFENRPTVSHKYLVQKSKSLWKAGSEMTEHSFLVLIKKWHKLCFENSSCKLLALNNHKLILGMADVWPPKISIVYGSLICGSNFCWIKVQSAFETSGVGGEGASAPRKVLICWKFGQNLWRFEQNLWKSG